MTMTDHSKVDRRHVLRSTAVIGAASIGLVAPFVAIAATEGEHAPEDLLLLDLWRQRTAAWIVANDAQEEYDLAFHHVCRVVHADKIYDEAYALAKKDSKVRFLEKKNDRLHEVPHRIERRIAQEPFAGPLGIAIKLALCFCYYDDDPDANPRGEGMEYKANEHAALCSIYHHFVAKAGGLSPYREWRDTEGV